MFRSKAEEDICNILKEKNIPYQYENSKVHYEWYEKKKYIPDFFLLNNGIILEVKGRFKIEDRKKHLFIKEQKPWLDIRFIFTNPKAKLYKKGKMTNGSWCDKYEFKYCSIREGIPEDWIDERKRSTIIHKIFNELTD